MVQPAYSFLCCGPLSLGVKAVAWYHLFYNAYMCTMAIGNVTLQLPEYGYQSSTSSQIFTAAWALAGIPVILIGLWGVYRKLEPHVRIYLYYLIASVLIDTAYLFNLMILEDACTHVTLLMYVRGGRAFACGVARSISIAMFVVLTVVMLYFIYIVWSYCEDLTSGGTAAVIADLLDHVDGRKRLSGDPFDSATYADAYGNVRPKGFGYNAVDRPIMHSAPPVGGMERFASYLA